MTNKQFSAITVFVCAILLIAFYTAAAIYMLFREIWK